MTIDRLRLHVLCTWVAGVGICYAALAIAVLDKGRFGLTFANITVPASHLWDAVAPTLVAMIGTYFSKQRRDVSLTAGQRTVALLLSYAYIVSFILLTLAMLFILDFKLDQDATKDTPAVNHYSILSHLQPLVIAGLFFLFGKGSDRSTR
jgi:hypothetical protein